MLGPGGGAPEAQRLYTLNYRQMCLFLTFFVTLAGHELVWGVQGAEPPEAKGFWAINNGQMSIFLYLFVTLAGHKLVLDPGGGAPRS